jgi:hypothetical protein
VIALPPAAIAGLRSKVILVVRLSETAVISGPSAVAENPSDFATFKRGSGTEVRKPGMRSDD